MITERVTDAIVEIDDEWRFTMVNDRAAEIYGVSEEDLLGEYFWDVFEWGRGTVFEEEYREVMKSRQASSFEAYYGGIEDLSGIDGWFEVDVYPENDGGISFYFRDITDRKRREDRSVGLNETLAEFMDTASKQEVADIVATAAEDRLHLPYAVVALVDDASGELQPAAQTAAAARRLDASSLFDQADGVGWQVFINGEPATIELPPGDHFEDRHEVDELVVHPLAGHGVIVLGSPGPDDNFAETVVENMRTTLDRIHSDRRLRERDERLQEQNESLSHLNRINEVIRNIDRVLVSGSSRQEIQQAICEELTAGDMYTFAWFGVYDSASNRVSPVSWAGKEKGYLDAVSLSPGDDSAARPPAAEVVTTHEPRVTDDVLANPPFEGWEKSALNRGFRANMALPIIYDASLYGVLDIYSDQQNAFDELEREVLIELSDTIAYAINAVDSKKALVSDTVIDLELRLDPADHPLIAFLVEDDDRSFELDGVVPTGEGDIRLFYAISGASHEAVEESTTEATEITDIELVSENDGSAQYEATATEESMIHWVLNRGGVLRSIAGDETGGTVRIELFGDARLRDFIDQFQSKYPNSELIASRERERPIHTRNDFLDSYEERLSARQREVLRTAYLSGYFESPRERNATAIAHSMDISQPTFSTHLRAGLRNLFGLLFDEHDPD